MTSWKHGWADADPVQIDPDSLGPVVVMPGGYRLPDPFIDDRLEWWNTTSPETPGWFERPARIAWRSWSQTWTDTTPDSDHRHPHSGAGPAEGDFGSRDSYHDPVDAVFAIADALSRHPDAPRTGGVDPADLDDSFTFPPPLVS